MSNAYKAWASAENCLNSEICLWASLLVTLDMSILDRIVKDTGSLLEYGKSIEDPEKCTFH